MLGGAALAAGWSLRPAAPGWTGRPRWRWTIRAAVAAFVILALGTRIEYFPRVLLLLIGVTTLMVAAATDARFGVARLLQHPVMCWVGRRSYGIYLWHEIYRGLFEPWPRGPAVVVVLAATLLSAELSYRLVETPALRLKSRFVRA